MAIRVRLEACIGQVELHRNGITPANALALVSAYDVVVDATDNAPTRYLISDACVVAGKPLVSGAALGTDGQLTVYNNGADGVARCTPLLHALIVAADILSYSRSTCCTASC
jgi:molybdopterin/thiamine biosynthesis adenylyltransferase